MTTKHFTKILTFISSILLTVVLSLGYAYGEFDVFTPGYVDYVGAGKAMPYVPSTAAGFLKTNDPLSITVNVPLHQYCLNGYWVHEDQYDFDVGKYNFHPRAWKIVFSKLSSGSGSGNHVDWTGGGTDTVTKIINYNQMLGSVSGKVSGVDASNSNYGVKIDFYFIGYNTMHNTNLGYPWYFVYKWKNGPLYARNNEPSPRFVNTKYIYFPFKNPTSTVKDFPVDGIEDTTLNFTNTNFSSNFSYSLGNPLHTIKIVSLPANGTLKLNSTNITVGQNITSANLGYIKFVPKANWNGITSFTWKGSHDGTKFSDAAATCSIDIAADNDIPTVSDVIKNGKEDTDLKFTLANFTSSYQDVESNPLNEIQIVTLPVNGRLKINSTNITKGQQITRAQIADIIFDPNPNWNGNTSFTWKASDNGTKFSDVAATCSIDIAADNDIPTVSDDTKEGTEDTDLRFEINDFTSNYDDIELNPLKEIQIVRLPINGRLKLNTTNITTVQQITRAQLANIIFEPNPDWKGTTSFRWKASDDGTYFSTVAAIFTIDIGEKNDIPTVSNIQKYGTEDTDLPFETSDFTSKYQDIELNPLKEIQIVELPSNGRLKLNTTNITTGQQITRAQLADIIFDPNLNWNGNTSFRWKASDDGTKFSDVAATVAINIAADNDIPTVSDFTKSGIKNTVVPFTVANFASKYRDIESNSLKQIKIETLPDNGVLKVNTTNITTGQKITLAQLPNITFVPNANWKGSTSFTWKASDDDIYFSAVAATVTINISEVVIPNAPPTADDQTLRTLSSNPIRVKFKDSYFVDSFSDPEGQSLEQIKITVAPSIGNLRVGSRIVGVGNAGIISFDELSELTLEDARFLDDDATEETIDVNFMWQGYDGTHYSNAANFDLEITKVTIDAN